MMVLGSAMTLLSQSPAPPDSVVAARTKHIAAQLRCPVCQGLSLQDSQSELSHQMKGVIHDQILAGKTDAQVMSYFVTKYGEWILLEPPAHGFNLAVYLLPFIMLFGGMGVLYVSVKKWTKPAATSLQN
ncbi:MAG TPA: cytochrome c-type biogenesis protein [Longimicrobiales bacterium]